MSWLGEREQQGRRSYANIKIPIPPNAEQGHAHAVRVQMPAVGLFIYTQGPLDLIQGQRMADAEKKLTLLDLKYRGWNLVRKGAISSDGFGFYGFRGYYEGLGWTNEEINTHLLQTGQHMLDAIVRLHPHEYSLRRSCLAALSGEKPFTYESYRELSATFGATLGRLRTLVLNKENIHIGTTSYEDSVSRARRENASFHDSARAMAIHLPQSVIDFNPAKPEEFSMLYYLPVPDVTIPKPSTEAGLIIDKIGIVGLPIMRVIGDRLSR